MTDIRAMVDLPRMVAQLTYPRTRWDEIEEKADEVEPAGDGGGASGA